MKTKRNCRGVFLLLYLAFFIAQSCQQDDETIIEGTLLSVEQVESTTQIVSGDEIPNVINFVKQQTNDKLQVSLKTTFSDSRQADLVIGNLSIDVVKQITNAYGRSNYSFVMIKTVDSPELSYINYIVKDTRYGMYGYFIEYVPLDQNSEGNLLNDQGEFHGTIRIYNQYGIYVGSNTFNNGVRATSDYENDCDNSNNGGGGQDGGEDPGDGPGDGTGSDGGDGPGPGDGPGDGDSGDGGTGGENIEIIITCGCDPEHEGGVDGNDDCHCTIPDEIVIDIRTPDDYYNKTGKRDPLRYPCSPDNENIQDQPCRCPSDVDDGQTDVDPQDENNDIPILLDLFEIAQLNEYIEPNLTANDLIIISELGIHSELLGYLVNNVNPDGPITFEESYFNINPEEWVVYYEEVEQSSSIDLVSWMDCFTDTSGFTNFNVTMYVDQPVPNQPDTWENDGTLFNPDINVGHTFFSVSMSDGTNSINQTIGFYPQDGVSPTSPNATGIFLNDAGHHYDVSISVNVSEQSFSQVISTIASLVSSGYNLNDYNCSDAGLDVFNETGIIVPDNDGTWPLGGGTNPGTLGQDIRIFSHPDATINPSGGSAPSSEGGC